MKNKKKKNINKLVYKRLRLRATAISSLSAGIDENWKGAPRSFSWLLTACLQDLQLLDSFFGNSNTVTVSQVVWRPSYDKRMSSFGSLALFLYPCLRPELDQLAQALLAWSLVLVDDFPCSLRSWRDCCARSTLLGGGADTWNTSSEWRRSWRRRLLPIFTRFRRQKNYSTCTLIPPATQIFLSFERPSRLMKWWYYVKVV